MNIGRIPGTAGRARAGHGDTAPAAAIDMKRMMTSTEGVFKQGEAGVSLHRGIEIETEWVRLATGSRSGQTGRQTLWRHIWRPSTKTCPPPARPLLELRRATSG